MVKYFFPVQFCRAPFIEDDFDETGVFKYSEFIYDALLACGNSWNEARNRNDTAGMAYWHQVAESYRGKGPNPDSVESVPLWDDPSFIVLSSLSGGLGVRGAKVVGTKALTYTGDQQALINLAKTAKQLGGCTEDEARTLLNWANEYGIRARGPEIHINRKAPFLHFHIGGINHIPIKR